MGVGSNPTSDTMLQFFNLYPPKPSNNSFSSGFLYVISDWDLVSTDLKKN